MKEGRSNETVELSGKRDGKNDCPIFGFLLASYFPRTKKKGRGMGNN